MLQPIGQQPCLIKAAFALAQTEKWNRNNERRFAISEWAEFCPGVSEQPPQSSAQSFPAAEFKLEDQQAQIPPVNSEGPGKIKRRGACAARAAEHLDGVSGVL